ncbi:MAG: UPF0179 family protein [Candidatus Methanoperedens sp.]|nr:UPF0179 family protein [Candidatus Methanoperedens sp.]MCE8427367.1 UPF0179 family protein [Candidatus Methanoperedens sp.]
MEESDIIITLIGTKLAKVGNEFIFKGGARECEPCKLNKTCLGLNSGSTYKIINLRKGVKHECAVHDTGVLAVEVMEIPVRMTVESRKAIKGSTIVYDLANCNNSDCENYVMCRPSGLKKGEKFTIIDVLDELSEQCEKGFSLKVVEVKRT